MSMHTSNADIEAWACASRLLIESAYLLSRDMDPGEAWAFSLVIDSAAQALGKAADEI